MARRGSRWLWRSFLLGLGLLFVGVKSGDSGFGVRLVLAGLVLSGVPLGVWWRRWSGSIGMVRRGSARSRWNQGLASRWQVVWKASRFAMRRQMRTLRPSYREMSWWRRLRVPTSEFAYRLCKVGWLWVWASCEDVKLTLGGPRHGKSVEEICRIIDAPGAVVATSTRADLYEKTHRLRAARGPVFVFNPSGIGGIATDVSFDPLSGCTDPKTAMERAGDLIAGASTSIGGTSQGDREHWAGQARDTLAVLMHAAALGGASMRDVHAWASNPAPYHSKVREMLEASPEAVGFGHDLDHFVTTNDRTRTSITQSIRPALMWLHDPGAARAAGQPVTAPVIDATGVTVPDGPPPAALDVEALLFGHGTVYLLGAEDAHLAPLLTALTGHIARTGRQVAGRLPDGRLDPPATFALDEAAIICLIPLDKWSSDFGGRNMPMHILVQSSAQLAQRWGQHGAAAITNNAGAVVIFGGTKDEADLRAHSTLIGDREERATTRDHHGKVISETTHRVPIFSPAQLAQLPPFRVVVIRRGLPPVIGRAERYWKRADYRALQRADRRAQRAKAWAHRREIAAHHWTELKAGLAEIVEVAADLARQLHQQHQQVAERRAQRRAIDAEAERATHESIDPQPAGPDRHEPTPDPGRDDEAGEGGDSDD
jgi:type IV secretion system protein VirD4